MASGEQAAMSHLLIHKGPNQGQRVSLDQPRTVLGRDSVCDIVLFSTDVESKKHLVISRKHAIVTRDGNHYYVEDGDGEGKESRNHTYINGELVPYPGRVLLQNDDVIRICDFLLIFHEGEASDPPSSVDAAISHDSSSVYLAQPAEKLKTLLEITNRLTHTLALDVLLPQVVEDLLQIFRQADRAFLILVDETTGELSTRCCKTRRADQESQTTFSTSIVHQCLNTVQGLLLSNDVSANQNMVAKLPDTESVAGLALRSVMCVPLWSQDGKAFGVLLLDTQNEKKKFTEEDLNLLMAVANQASIALANARFHRDALARERLDERRRRDLEFARQVVKSFLPACLPEIPEYEFFACSESALEVGGDYFDLIPLDGQRLGVVVGDVAGKGVAAALVMARFSAEARACLRTVPDLAAAVCQLNALMQPINLTDRFVTLVAMMLDLATHTITVVNAGHPAPLLLRRATGETEDILSKEDSGPPIGVLDCYPYVARQIALQPGDNLILFSDGVTESLDVNGRLLGTKGLGALLAHLPPRQLGDRILQAVKQHADGCAQHDDITLVCFGRI
jgi:serine phosphatase RsbU (regulator of sigma subunit)/pSer/pThr/pTyr-binding forkhead associated (FHA) protein